MRRHPFRRAQRTPTVLSAIPLLLLAVALASAGACATNPVTGRPQLALITVQQEIEMGRQAHEQVLGAIGAYDDPELQRYVDRIGQRLAQASERPDLPWTFTVVDDPSINAFALPGGFIYLTRGILSHMQSEAEMVSVVGHEIGHVTARHSVERLSKAQLAQVGLVAGMIASPELRNYGDLAQTGLQVMFLKFSRDDERQSDDLGFRYMNQAGYDPREMVEMFGVLERVSEGTGQGRLPDWLATHPSPANRIERLQQAIAAAQPEVLGDRVDRGAFLQRIDGIAFGQDPREGYFRGSTFYHPELAFELRFPEGWRTENQKQAVGAMSPRDDALVVLTLAQAASPREAARRFFAQQGIQEGRSWAPGYRRLQSVARSFSVDRAQGPDLAGLVAFVEHEGRVFQLLGYTTENRARGYEEELRSSLASFDRLTERRYLDVEPKRLDLVTLPRPMTLEQGRAYKRVVGGELPG